MLLQVILVFSPRHSTAFRHFEESNFMEYLNECFYFCADVVAWYGNKSYVIYSLNYHSSNNSKHFFQGFYPKKPVTIEFLAWKILKVYIAKKFRAHGSYNHQSQQGHCLIIAMIRLLKNLSTSTDWDSMDEFFLTPSCHSQSLCNITQHAFT